MLSLCPFLENAAPTSGSYEPRPVEKPPSKPVKPVSRKHGKYLPLRKYHHVPLTSPNVSMSFNVSANRKRPNTYYRWDTRDIIRPGYMGRIWKKWKKIEEIKTLKGVWRFTIAPTVQSLSSHAFFSILEHQFQHDVSRPEPKRAEHASRRVCCTLQMGLLQVSSGRQMTLSVLFKRPVWGSPDLSNEANLGPAQIPHYPVQLTLTWTCFSRW